MCLIKKISVILVRAKKKLGGETKKDVKPDESYTSDTVTINIPEGHYLVWEWTVSGKGIPCSRISMPFIRP